MVTVEPTNGGGLVTTSFPPNEGALRNFSQHFTMSSLVRGSIATKHTQHTGYYVPTLTKKGKLTLRHILLLASGVTTNDTTNDEEEVFLATISNVASLGQLMMMPRLDVVGSTIRLVTATFAKTLPKHWPHGTAFKSTNVAVASIKDLLPPTNTSFVLTICPKTCPILPGDAWVVKGAADDSIADVFRAVSEYAHTWLLITTSTDEGVIPFNLELQEKATAEKTTLAKIYPQKISAIKLSPTHVVALSTPPLVDEDADEDEADIQAALNALTDSLKACVARNMPAPTPNSPSPPQQIDIDLESLAGPTGATAEATKNNDDRVAAKLRLLTAGYSPKGGVTLMDLNDDMKQTLALSKASQAESFGNLLASTNDSLSDTTDCHNRSANWPSAYNAAPVVLNMILKCSFSNAPITDLQAAAKKTAAGCHTGYFLPHGPELLLKEESMKEETSMRENQILMGEDPSRTSRVNTKTICTTSIRDRHVLIECCANITVLLATLVTFDHTSVTDGDTPFIQCAARKIGLFLSCKEYRAYTNRSMCSAPMNYFVFNVLDRTLSMYYKILNDESAINAARPGNATSNSSRISTKTFAMATTCLDNGLDRLINICADAETLEEPLVFKTSPFNNAKPAPAIQAPPTKRPALQPPTERDPKKSKDEKKGKGKIQGAFIVKNGFIPMPEEWPDGEVGLCPGQLRDNSVGCRKGKRAGGCTLNHDPPVKWSKKLLAQMKDWVENHDTISWNYALASPQLLGLTYANGAQVPE